MRKLVAILALGVIAFSCKKDDLTAYTKENLSGSYNTQKIVLQIGTTFQDITNARLAVCNRDDIMQLNADFSYVYQDAGITCNPNSSHTGIWDLTGKDTIIVERNPMRIVSYDGHILQLRDSSFYNGVKYPTTYYYVKQ